MSDTNGNGRVRVDMANLTMREKIAAADMADLTGDQVSSMAGALRLQAAFAWVVLRRDNETYTYEQALDLKDSDVEFVSGPPTPGGETGVTQLLSPASGDSTRAT
jgi:hypothetical protein